MPSAHAASAPPPPAQQQHSQYAAPSAGPPGPPAGQRRRAVLVGINYLNCAQGRLSGCINDARSMHAFFSSWGFQPTSIVLLTDDQRDPNYLPTRANIIQALQWLVQDISGGDSAVFHFSGHGGQVEASIFDVDEDDGMNETIIPMDYQQLGGNKGHIVDNDLHKILVKPLVQGARLLVIFDSCHSGTALDLPFIWNDPECPNASDTSSLSSRHKNTKFGLGGLAKGLTKEVLHHGKKAIGSKKPKKPCVGDVVSISGCQDHKTSADVAGAGAMSVAFAECMRQTRGQLTYMQLIRGMRQVCRSKGLKQVPQLCMGRERMEVEPFSV